MTSCLERHVAVQKELAIYLWIRAFRRGQSGALLQGVCQNDIIELPPMKRSGISLSRTWEGQRMAGHDRSQSASFRNLGRAVFCKLGQSPEACGSTRLAASAPSLQIRSHFCGAPWSASRENRIRQRSSATRSPGAKFLIAYSPTA